MRGGNADQSQQLVFGGENEPTGITEPVTMFGGDTLTGVPIAGGSTSGQPYAVIQRGGAPPGVPPTKPPAYMKRNLMPDDPKTYGGNMGRVIVPAALVLANNMMGRGRSLRYKGKGAFRGKSSRYSRARYSRRRSSRRRR